MRHILTTSQVQPQSTTHILMVRPVSFGYNTQTAESNRFQQSPATDHSSDSIQEQARVEFDQMVAQLLAADVDVTVFDDLVDPYTPDAIFPNNWLSMHQSGRVILYPMMAPNRRAERRQDIIDSLLANYHVDEVIDLTHFEQEGKFLEGTGSMVLDRRYKIAYACLSPRTHPGVLAAFEKATGYELVTFAASDQNDAPIYHTNVLMCVGDIFAVVCLEAIKNPDERYKVREALEQTNKYIVEISLDQMQQFAGNMLLIRNKRGDKLLVMSSRAYHSLTEEQIHALDDYAELMHVDLTTIENNGGGSARCMMAEIHLPQK